MFYAISWFLSFMVLGLWSLTCWGLHALTVWAVTSAGTMTSGASAAAANVALVPEWIRGWIPPDLAREFGTMIASTGPIVQGALDAMPALAGTATVLAWAIWGLGALIILALAIGAHLLIAFFQRRRTESGLPPAAPVR
ncbi:hypothetical protein [Acidovorax sp. SUPP3334]|uniref:hypothetical protein n=1 Tax=Acidovorax sp. SUPP3334 TaxID=2920881 RepID=UPI0023DE3C06|nr:hypothetical protein [Acidovorax sp. SUPP3334]GKT20570.1 hypothetical protein AVHM3334_01530 [Acidovorax sp. SUPP3334]